MLTTRHTTRSNCAPRAWTSPHPELRPRCDHVCCSLEELLGLLVERSSLLHCDEALDTQSLPCLLDCNSPALDVGVSLLTIGNLLLGHNLAALVLDQIGLGQAREGLGFGAVENNRPCHFAFSNLAHCHELLRRR